MISSQLYCGDPVCPPSALMVHCQIKCEDLHYHATYWPLSSGAQLCNSDQRVIFTADWPVEIKLGWEFSVTHTDTEEVRGHQGKCELRNVLLTEVLQNDRLKMLKGINPSWSVFFPPECNCQCSRHLHFLEAMPEPSDLTQSNAANLPLLPPDCRWGTLVCLSAGASRLFKVEHCSSRERSGEEVAGYKCPAVATVHLLTWDGEGHMHAWTNIHRVWLMLSACNE